MQFARRWLGIISIVVGFIIIAYVFYANSKFASTTRTFSPYTLLTSSWEQYKTLFINRDGRVFDHTQGDITTSEGQSYAMLRAVWIDDRETFDLTWKWTKENLQKSDNLFGWRWGLREDGSYGFLPGGGENSAADADTDIALALILASRRWNDESYLQQAKPILAGIWRNETGIAAGKRYLIAGNWAKNPRSLIVNPSYFAPYAWRIFAETDLQRDWNSLITPAYELLQKSGEQQLDKPKAVGLPPDWVAVNLGTGELSAPAEQALKTNYGYDAIRVPWRIGLDYEWNKNPEAKEYLSRSFTHLADQYRDNKKLVSTYSHDGEEQTNYESPSLYAAALGYFMYEQPEIGKQIYQDKILRLYSNDVNGFKADIPYYEQNWLWFGAGLYNHMLKTFD